MKRQKSSGLLSELVEKRKKTPELVSGSGNQNGVIRGTPKEEEKESINDGLAKGLVINLVKGLVKELSDTQIKILNLISEDKYITKSAMAKQIGTSTTTIDNHMKTLKSKNILQRVGSRKEGYWQIIEQE